MIPISAVAVKIPKRSILARSKAEHNRFTKEAVRESLFKHWMQNAPEHFKQSATTKYGYKPRDPKYIKRKRRKYGFRADNPLTFTGKSRDYITRTFNVTVGGAAEGGGKGIVGKLTTRFQWKGGTGRMRSARAGVTPADMVDEVKRVTSAEVEAIGKNIRNRYLSKF